MMKEKCKTCKEWRNKQRELDYVEDYGICTGISDYGNPDDIKIVPHEELSLTIEYKFKDNNLAIKGNEYEFCTHESFGCNRWSK